MKNHDFEISPRAHCHRFRVSAADIDELGHANNVVWVRWVNEAALAHCDAVGFGPAVCIQRRLAWVVRRHDIEYLLPALRDEELEAWTWAETLRGVTSLRRTLFRRGDKVLARAETTWILIDLDAGKPRRVPEDFLSAFGF
jgi:acyl-CoA thioester hydrolase